MKQTKKTKQFYKKIGKQYLEDIKDLTLPVFDDFTKLIKPNGLILDIGCAGGRDSKRFVDRGFDVIGIDLVNKFLEVARKNVPATKFIKQDVTKMDFPANHFDAVWATSVLMHISNEDLTRVLSNIYKILKPEGKFYFNMKEGAGTKYVEDELTQGHKRLLTFYSAEEVKEIVTKTGLKIIKSDMVASRSRKDLKWIQIWAEK